MSRPPTPDIPLKGTEETLLVGFLEFYRAELLDRAWGLDHDQLRQTHGPSRLTLAGLISHMTIVEYLWFRRRFLDIEIPEPFLSLDWEADDDAEMTIGEASTDAEVLARFHEAVEDSRAHVAAATSFDQLSVNGDANGDKWDLRWILIHMIEEYARHCGHADMIREAIDGDLAN